MILVITGIPFYWYFVHTSVVVPAGHMFTGEKGGCGNFVLYRFNGDNTLAITVRVDESSLPLEANEESFSIEHNRKSIGVRILQFRRAPKNYFCSDIQSRSKPIVQWTAICGNLTVVNDDSTEPPTSFRNSTHRVSVRMKDVILRQDGTSAETKLDDVHVDDIWVGWYSG